jgi:hypothetical protein
MKIRETNYRAPARVQSQKFNRAPWGNKRRLPPSLTRTGRPGRAH